MKIKEQGLRSNDGAKKQVVISITDKNNVAFAAAYMTKKIEDFLKSHGLAPTHDPAYNILEVDTTEWEISK